MCCFSGNVRSVSNTRIFGRLLSEGRQALIYSMSLDTPTAVAMILPIPVAAGSGEEAVRFVSFEKYANVFSDIARTFSRPKPLPDARNRMTPRPAAAAPLKVESVGAFNASFVPTIKDFSRLDAQFRLPDGVWEKLGSYATYGFAVFKLREGRHEDIHPMAFSFPTALSGKLFFPTVHIHDGKVHKEADFDHTLYAQTASGRAPTLFGWEESEKIASADVRMGEAQGLIDGPGHFFRRRMNGSLKNVDVIV
jgi:hypothetical protein